MSNPDLDALSGKHVDANKVRIENERLRAVLAERERALAQTALVHAELRDGMVELRQELVTLGSTLRYELGTVWQGYQTLAERLPRGDAA